MSGFLGTFGSLHPVSYSFDGSGAGGEGGLGGLRDAPGMILLGGVCCLGGGGGGGGVGSAGDL